MGIFDFVKKQFIDVIDWTETSDGVLAFRYPMQDREIQNGGQVTVTDTQLALFINEGEVADLFTPGRHTLSTKTLPVLTNLRNWDKAFASPFKSDVVFFSTREQIDQRWGTSQPITFRDKEFGAIRLRANGTYSYKLKNPKVFFKKLSGTREVYSVSDLEPQLRALVVETMTSFLASSQIPFLDMAGNQTKFAQTLKGALAQVFEDYGLSLETFTVQSLSLPEELQKYLDKSSQMNLVGNMQKFAQFQSIEAIEKAASNPGGLAGAGMGLSAGMAIGQNFNQAMGQVAQGSPGNSTGGSAAAPAEDPLVTIGKLHDLMTKGILSQAEFDAKKAELLKKLT